ncbi:TonB-dependent receptor [Idiomarina sp. A28L]|uniref:TonB-dependent receptor n=1 Tax=Idiomarina sp. A28L TaxID=1036674 RepID=UPI000213871D|nr:TonB-dependent receptor [Idiomarina sp. A28L]EGN74807.1 TonB-dependent receptor [Idiomarina sp. A28L]
MLRTPRFSRKVTTQAVLLALALPMAGVVQAATTVQGEVKNANGQPLSGVQVEVVGTSRSVFTDQDGRFVLRQVEDGTVTLRFQYLGLPSVERAVQVTGANTEELDVVLTARVESIERIQVTGQREAQNRALNAYRASDAIASFVESDDMGQFVDQNVAESLQRIVGASISRDQGEGRFVSVRGVDAGLSTVTVNGMRIGTPEDGSRAVPLDVIPTGSVEGISVVKAPTPNMPGDAIGGSVDVRSASPFDREGRSIRYRAEASYNELSGETSPKLQFNFSDVLNDNFGVSFGVNFLDRKLESDNIEAEYDMVDFGDGEVFSIIEAQERKYYVNRERLGTNLNLEYRPDSNTKFFANTVYSEFKDAETRQRSIYIFEDGDLTSFDGEQGAVADMPEDSFRRRIRFRTKEQDTLAFSAGGEHMFETWDLSYRAGISTTKERVLDENEGRYEYDQGNLDATYRIGSGIPSFEILRNGTADTTHRDNANYVLDRAVLEPKLIDDNEYSVGFDATYPYAFNNQSLTLQAGVDLRWKDKDVDVNEIELRSVPDARLDALTITAPSYGLGNLGQGISYSRYVDFFTANRSEFNLRPRDEQEAIELLLAEDFVADEDVFSGYLMGTWDLDRTRVIAGARVERTKYSATGNQLDFLGDGSLQVTDRSVSSDYTNVLPGIHVAYDLSPDMVLRGAWTNTIARPSFSDISPRASVDREDNEVELGNPDLKPYEAMNFDLVFDWYYNQGSVLSVGAFYKDIDNYVVELTSNDVPEFDGFDVTRPTNSTKASIAGMEFNLQHSFTSENLQGFLVGANLTALDTDLELFERQGESFALPDAAELSGNLYVGYERERFGTRVSLSHRDKMLTEVGDDTRYDIYVSKHTQLDWTASYNINRHFQLVFEVTNITDEPLELYQGTSNYTLQFEEYGRTFAIGFKGQF